MSSKGHQVDHYTHSIVLETHTHTRARTFHKTRRSPRTRRVFRFFFFSHEAEYRHVLLPQLSWVDVVLALKKQQGRSGLIYCSLIRLVTLRSSRLLVLSRVLFDSVFRFSRSLILSRFAPASIFSLSHPLISLSLSLTHSLEMRCPTFMILAVYGANRTLLIRMRPQTLRVRSLRADIR